MMSDRVQAGKMLKVLNLLSDEVESSGLMWIKFIV